MKVMNKNMRSVGQYIAANRSNPQRFEVRIKKYITIVLFAVGLSSSAVPYYEISQPKSELAEITMVREATSQNEEGLSLLLRDNLPSASDRLYESLKIHKGDMLSTEQMMEFNHVAKQLQSLAVKDAFVRYNETENHISYDLLLDNLDILHLTQYFDQPTDQLVYSVERDGLFIKAGYAPIQGFNKFIEKVVDEKAIVS